MLFNKFSGLEEIVDATVEDNTLSKEAVSDRYQLAVQVRALKGKNTLQRKSISI